MARLESFTFWERVLMASFAGFFNTAALVGNVLVCLTIYRKPHLRANNNLYVATLSVLGITFACFVGPSVVATYIAGRWVFGWFYCGLQVFLIHYVEFALLHTIALAAFNRYCRMVKPVLYRRFFRKKRSSVLILVSVLLFQAFFFGVFSLPAFSRYEFNYERASCSIKYHSKTTNDVYVVLKVVTYFFLTCTVVLFCNWKVYRVIQQHVQSNIWQSQRNGGNAIQNAASQVNMIREIRVTKPLLAVVVLFLVCWIPEYIISVLLRINPDLLPPAAKRSLLLVPFVCCASNPVVYAAMNQEFRSEFRRLFTCGRGTRRVIPAEQKAEGNMPQSIRLWEQGSVRSGPIVGWSCEFLSRVKHFHMQLIMSGRVRKRNIMKTRPESLSFFFSRQPRTMRISQYANTRLLRAR